MSKEDFEAFIKAVNVLINAKVSGVTGPIMADAVKQHNPQANRKQAFEIFTTVVDTASALIFTGKDSDNSNAWSALWKVPVDVSHPRIRLFKPQLVFDVTASIDGTQHGHRSGSLSISEPKELNQEVEQSVFLAEFMPLEEVNLFETLSHDNNLKDINSKLFINRVTSRTPAPLVNNRSVHSEDGFSSSKSSPKPSRSSTPSQFKLQSPPPGNNGAHSTNDVSTPQPNNQPEPSSAISQKPITTIESSVELPVYPAVNLRLRCIKSMGAQDSIVAIFEIENSESAQFNVLIKSAHLEFTAGSAVLFGDCRFPFWLSPGENYSMAYNLSHADAGLLKSRVKPMTILLNSVPVLGEISEEDIKNITPDSEAFNYVEVGPLVVTKWDTIVDFGVAPISNTASSLAPVTLAGASGAVKKLFKISRTSSVASLRPSGNGDASPVPEGRDSRSNTVTSQLQGFVISFSGPSTVKVGEVFKWRVFAVNKSQNSRHLSLYIQPREKGFKANSHGTFSSTPMPAEKKLPIEPKVLPVLDRAQLQKLYEDSQTVSASGNTGIVSLVNDVRIGPLHGQACFETEISMLALTTGQHSLEGLCIIDLTTGDSYDCGKLLDVVITE